MNNDLPPGIETKEKKIVMMIIALVITAAIGWIGYNQVIQWHENALESAVTEQQQIMAEKNADLEYRILELHKKLEMLKPSPASNDRMAEVFGDPPQTASVETAPSCDTLRKKIYHFFEYLNQNNAEDKSQAQQPPAEIYRQAIRALEANPPMIVDETRDIVSLKHNLAHFYRVLKKDRIEMVKTILALEDDVLEHAMADFYTYYVFGDCCEKNNDEPGISLNTLYEYAGFFTNTIAGKSYLFRRKPVVRYLMDYYSVLILDRANEAGINRYGIDIRPLIDIAKDNIINQNNLVFQDQYIETLTGLGEKYRS